MLCWLFELKIGGRLINLSSFPVTYDGKHWKGGMDSLSLKAELGIATGPPDSRSVVIDVLPDADISLLLSYGHDVSVGSGSLYLWDIDEEEHLAKTIFENGIVNLPEVGGEYEILSFTLKEEPYEDVSLLVDPDMVLSTTSDVSRTPRESDLGKPYPWVYGRPGTYSTRLTSGNVCSGYPGIVIGSSSHLANVIVVAGHFYNESGAGTPSATITYIDSTTGALSERAALTLYNETDDNGYKTSVVVVSSESAALRGAETFWVSIDDTAEIHKSSTDSGYITTVGQLLENLSYESSIPTDHGSFVKLKDYFPQPVSLWIDDPDISPMDLILEIVKDLPIGIYSTANGITAVYIDTEADGFPTQTLIDGVDSWRTDAGIIFLNNSDEIINEVIVKYAYDSYKEEYIRHVTALSEEYENYGGAFSKVWSPKTTSAYARSASANYLTERKSEVIEIPWAYDYSTALRVAKWHARYKSVSPKRISVMVEQKKARYLELGQKITYTNQELNISEKLAIITSIEYSDSDLWEIGLMLFSGTVSDIMEKGGGSFSSPPSIPPEPIN